MTGESSAGTDVSQIDTDLQTATAESGDVTSGVDVAAQSSSAQDATEKTLEDVIRAAAKSEGENPAPESSDGEASQEPATSEAKPTETANPEGQAKDEAEVPFHKHPRWQAMLRERDTYKASHEQYQQIQSYMTTNELAPEEVAKGFEVMALMRRDPEKALEMLLPYMQSLELVTGRRLPDDLSQRVEDGVVDEETARETARLRIAADRARALEAHQQQAQQQQAQTQNVGAVQAAVRGVEQEFQTSDPDYARKQPFVLDRVRALILAERPQNADQAVALVRRAHAEISDQLKPMIQRRPVQTVTSGDASTSSRPEPKSLLDVVRQAAKST